MILLKNIMYTVFFSILTTQAMKNMENKELIKRTKVDNKPLAITMKKSKSLRSNNQESFFWKNTKKCCKNCCIPCLQVTWNGVDHIYSKIPPCDCPLHFKDEKEVTTACYKFFAIGIVTCLTCRGAIAVMDYYE